MNAYIITNLITNNQYRITDADLATKGETIDSWVAKKANAYGKQEQRFPAVDPLGQWTIEATQQGLDVVVPAVAEQLDPETNEVVTPAVPEQRRPLEDVHPEWYKVGTPVLDGLDVVVPAEHTIITEDLTAEVIAQKISEAWTAADTLGKEMDENSRNSVLWLYFDPASSEEKKNRILAVQAWWSNLWAYYATVKAGIQADPDFAYDFEANVGHCPWTIWEIAAA